MDDRDESETGHTLLGTLVEYIRAEMSRRGVPGVRVDHLVAFEQLRSGSAI